jgi:hypothetical protein
MELMVVNQDLRIKGTNLWLMLRQAVPVRKQGFRQLLIFL